MLKNSFFILLTCLSLSFYDIYAQTGEASASAPEKNGKQGPELKEEKSQTKHSIKINGADIAYTATTGTLLIKDSKDTPKATFFYVAYTKEEEDPTQRPITFCFNGGPGACAMWLHLGFLGPKTIEFDEKNLPKQQCQLSENPFSLLDVSDLVFIDPISAGYGRVAPGEKETQYYSVEEDARSFGEFIRVYLSRNNRWCSPKFIAGESYGTTRAAMLADVLHNEKYVYLNGVILISTAINFQNHSLNDGNDTAFTLFLPSYTATAWFHKKLDQNLQQDFDKTVKEAEQFAVNEYSVALLKGDTLTDEEKTAIAQKISHYTGLPVDYILRHDLRISYDDFGKELFRKEGLFVSRFNGSLLAADNDVMSDFISFDPNLDSIAGYFLRALHHYLSTDLKFHKDEEYNIFADSCPWDYGKGAKNRYLNVTDKLKDVMTMNPQLKVFTASGYYDLALPYFATETTFNHFGLHPSLRKNIEVHNYVGGHMMYLYQPSLIKLSEDLHAFIKKAK